MITLAPLSKAVVKSLTCFLAYFSSIQLYIKNVLELAKENDYLVSSQAMIISTVIATFSMLRDINIFGVTNLVLLLVLGTVFIDAIFGVKKSTLQAKEAREKAKMMEPGSTEQKRLLQIAELKKFRPARLQFTFFKCVTLMGYLFFVKNLLQDGGESSWEIVLGFTVGVLTKAPVAIFWYYEFKSIGDNSEYIFKKKAPIFGIVEAIFEPRIFKFLNKKPNENEQS